MAGPAYRLIAKNKRNGTSAEFGVIWKNERGQMNIQFADQAAVDNSQGKKVLASTVIKNGQDYFLNVYENKPFDGGGRASRPSEGSDIDF